MIKFANENVVSQKLAAAMKSGDEKQIQEAWDEFHKSVADQVKADFAELQESKDAAVLAQRGYRQLTTKETKWYQKVIEALKSNNPKQAFTAIIGSDNEEDLMPTTIIEDVYKHLREEHPLLKAINFQYVGYITKWVLNDHSAQNAVWGKITEEIVKEITSSFKVVDIDQNKLSAYAIIEIGMLDLGPTFLDGYIRAVLAEAIFAGLEEAIVAGTGVNMPIGLKKDIHEGVSYSSSTGYPDKEKLAVKSFAPAEYGALVAKMAVTENGNRRKFTEVGLICNMVDYLTKVMPATTVLNAEAKYVNNLFPFPTTVYISNELEDGDAILFLKDEYFMGMGGSKNGVIEYSDEYKFLEDQRVFKVKQYGAGRAFDNTSALYLDISGVSPAFITVRNFEETVTA
ncbi:phage major capsid protein [Listeria monocytogenes]|nr:phage major capsid protein [Listeria monocytogenes]